MLKTLTPGCSQFAVRQDCFTFGEGRQLSAISAYTDFAHQCALILAAYGESHPRDRAIGSDVTNGWSTRSDIRWYVPSVGFWSGDSFCASIVSSRVMSALYRHQHDLTELSRLFSYAFGVDGSSSVSDVFWCSVRVLSVLCFISSELLSPSTLLPVRSISFLQ